MNENMDANMKENMDANMNEKSDKKNCKQEIM